MIFFLIAKYLDIYLTASRTLKPWQSLDKTIKKRDNPSGEYQYKDTNKMLLFATGLPTLETLLRHRHVEPSSWASAGKESSDVRVGSAFSVIFITKSSKSSKQVELTELGNMILWTPCLLGPFLGLAQWERRYFRCTGWQQQAIDCILLNEAGGVPWKCKLLRPVSDGTSSSLLCRRLQ